MKYLGVLLVGVIILTSGCSSEKEVIITEEEQLVIDLELIDSWLTDNGITDIQYHSSSMRYTINNKGTGERAQLADNLRVSYEGRFLETGVVFDKSNLFGPFILNASAMILGWYFILQEMDEGDEFTVYIPSKLAYGTRGNSSIPPNTVLVFDIKIIRIGI